MAYYCRLCKRWHYSSSECSSQHKVHASQRHTPKPRVRRGRRSFWDRF